MFCVMYFSTSGNDTLQSTWMDGWMLRGEDEVIGVTMSGELRLNKLHD